MVVQVRLLQPSKPAVGHPRMMHRIMDTVVRQIPQQHPRKHWHDRFLRTESHKPIIDRCQHVNLHMCDFGVPQEAIPMVLSLTANQN